MLPQEGGIEFWIIVSGVNSDAIWFVLQVVKLLRTREDELTQCERELFWASLMVMTIVGKLS